MYPKTSIKTPFPSPALSLPTPEAKKACNAAGIAYQRGEKPRSRRILTKLYQQQLQERHQVRPEKEPREYLRQTAWCAYFALICNQPEAAERLVNNGLSAAIDYPYMNHVLSEQKITLLNLQEQAAAALAGPRPEAQPSAAAAPARAAAAPLSKTDANPVF